MKKFVSLIAILTLGFILMACTPTKYTVTFESNGGSAVAAIEVESGKTFAAPTAPTRSGYAFDGWFKEAALTNPWVFATDTVTSNITLYAKWSVTDQAFVDQVFEWLNLGNITGLTNQSPRIIFPTNRDGVSITWSIDKPAFIQANGLINQPTFEEGDQTVTLTATLTKGSVTRTKVFTATVLKLASIEDTPPLLNEDFKSYTDGNILSQSGLWAPVSGKAGNSLFTVISTLNPAIPNGSKALKIEALTELQIEGSIAHSYDVLVFEVDLLQSSTSNASAINIQSSSSSPVVAFGLDGASLFYRTDNGTLMKTTININQWYTMRVEVDLVNKTMEAFYYEAGQLVSLTPGKVTYTGTTPFQSVFIRSGSSTTTTLREPAYITNLVVNRIEALPRPAEVIKLGQVTDIRPTVSIEEGSTFTVDIPKVYNYFGTQQLLVKDTDYTVSIDNPVNTAVPGDYVVTYTFTNSANASDIKVVTQNVNVYSAAEPNEISSVVSTQAGYLERLSDITVTVVQPSGTLYYLLSNNETETKAAIMAGVSQAITAQTVVLDDLNVGGYSHIHVFVDLNGDSNIVSHVILREAVTEITSVSQFVTVFSTTAADITTSYALLTDIDLSGIVWADGNTSFKAKLYGNGHTISNLTMTKTGTNYGGLFARMNGGMVRDLILDNVHVTSADRGGILVGRVENGNSSILNVVIMNSSITAANANGVGGVIGLVSRETILSNVTILDSDVIATGVKNVGGVVGRVDGGALLASDIYVRGVMVKSNVIDALDIAAGALVGYIRDSVASVVTANRIVIIDTVVDAQVAGALIGYNRAPGSATVQNAFVDVDFVHPSTVAAGLIGRVNNETDKLNTTSIFGVLTGSVEHVQAQAFVNTTVPSDLAWWTTNLPIFTTHDLWTLDSNQIFALDNYLQHSAPMITVDLVYNVSINFEKIAYRQGQPFQHNTPQVGGYQFVGWFLDEALTQALPEGYVVSTPVTIYGKYETVPASEVTFVTNVDGLTVPMQAINYGQLATLPVVPNQMIEGVLKEVVGWTLNGQPFDFSTPILANTELVAVWDIASLTVTFNGANPVQVVYGQWITSQPDLPTHFFEEVVAEWRLSGVAFDFNTPITADINLVSGFITPTVISIDTKEEFYYMATVESTYNFELSTDLDFTGYTWVYVNTSFKGIFDGKNYTVKNLSMTGSNITGIFPRANGATIKNLVLDHITIQTTERGGILVGRVENGDTVIQNIVIMNSSISGANSNGVGGLIGLVSRKTDVSNISIIDTIVQNTAVNVGGLVGRVDSAALNASDIFISGVTVISTSVNVSDVAASAFVGYVRDNVGSVLTAVRVVVLDTMVDGNATGAFVGYNRFPGTSSISNAFFEVTFVNNERSGFIGYNRDQVVVIDQSSVFGNITNNTPHSQALALTNSVNPSDLSWWSTNLSGITGSALWDIYDGRSYGLSNYVDTLPALVNVTLTYNITKPNDVLMLRVGDTFEYVPSVVDGYVFSGFYTNTEMTLELPNNLITGEITLYGKYEAVPPSQVSFVTNVDGLTVPTQDINYGQLATLPVVANQTIEGVLSKVTGWTLNGQPYDFSTPVIADIDLVAVWAPVTYTVTFDGFNPVEVAHGSLVSEPTEDPVHIFAERAFVEWRLAGVAYDFNTPVTGNLNLVAYFAAPVGDILISTLDQFHTMATVESTYSYKLVNNLDFSGYSWVYVNTSFKGIFDGQGYTISNLTLTGLSNIGGIFPRANGATIKNLVVDNVHVSTTGTFRAGILVGRIENTQSYIENIVIKNSSVYSSDTNGVGGLVGNISKSTDIFNVAIIDSNVENNVVNVGGLVGRIDGGALVIADDIFISGVTVKSNSANTSDVAASALIGYVANVADSVFSGVRIVVLDTIVDGNVTAAFVGYNRYPGTADLMDAYFEVTFVNNERSGLIGYNRDQVVVLDQSSIFGSFTNNTPHSQTVQLTNTAVPTDAAWWTTNLNNIATSSSWVINLDGTATLALLVD